MTQEKAEGFNIWYEHKYGELKHLFTESHLGLAKDAYKAGHADATADLANRDRENLRRGFELARERCYDLTKPVFGNHPYLTKERYENFEQFEREQEK